MEHSTKLSKVKMYATIIVGTFLMGLAVNIVYEPLNLVTGGLAGLGIVLKDWTGALMPGGIPVWLTTFVLNVPLFILAYLLKGKQFIGNTLFAAIGFNIWLAIIPIVAITEEDYVLASVFGGIIMGIGLGLVFANNCSTGGTDLLGAIVQVKMKHYSVAQILMIIDGAIVLLGAVVFGVSKALYAIIAVYITSKVMDGILEGVKFAKLAYVISEQYEEIANHVLTSMNRGATGIPAKGMYSNQDKKMLLCVVSKKEIVQLVDIVAQIDPKAFVIVSDVREVLGEGFIEYRQ